MSNLSNTKLLQCFLTEGDWDCEYDFWTSYLLLFSLLWSCSDSLDTLWKLEKNINCNSKKKSLILCHLPSSTPEKDVGLKYGCWRRASASGLLLGSFWRHFFSVSWNNIKTFFIMSEQLFWISFNIHNDQLNNIWIRLLKWCFTYQKIWINIVNWWKVYWIIKTCKSHDSSIFSTWIKKNH